MIEGLVHGPCSIPALCPLAKPLGVLGRKGLPHVPGCFDKNSLIGVLVYSVIGAVSGRVHIVVAIPVLRVEPIGLVRV